MDDDKGYLILTRRVGEIIMVGDEIEIIVSGIIGKQVKLGFYAPRDVKVNRKELWDSIQEEKENAR